MSSSSQCDYEEGDDHDENETHVNVIHSVDNITATIVLTTTSAKSDSYDLVSSEDDGTNDNRWADEATIKTVHEDEKLEDFTFSYEGQLLIKPGIIVQDSEDGLKTFVPYESQPVDNEDVKQLEIDTNLKKDTVELSKTDMDSVKACQSTEPKVQHKLNRFNPFDRELSFHEDYFENPIEEISDQPLSSPGSTASSWSIPTSGGDDIKNADLGLSEDYFSHPEGYFGLSSTEELEMAIDNCKEMILTATPHTDKHKNFVRKLVQLRKKLHEIREGPEPVEDGIKVVVGHKFKLKNSSSSRHYCEKCNAAIWGLLQFWYKCTECGYCCHDKCLNLIARTCARVKIRENPSYCFDICPERGLSAQNYRCAECRSQISFQSGYSEPRRCDYTGNYYCELCHWKNVMPIPARILHNWDFEPREVCRASKQHLKLMAIRAVIRVQDINPVLFNFVEELNEVRKLREELLIMKKYIIVCSFAMKDKLLLMLKDHQHYVDNSDTYSIQDLIDVNDDSLLPELIKIHSRWAQHIKSDCKLCQARGFICELCDEREILFPFDNIAVVCAECSSVLHRHCFAKCGAKCPRCDRKKQRNSN